tara:strand:- start:702 stop:1493 length:792 start_codon:yes stop_codon:yes gene_type:complete
MKLLMPSVITFIFFICTSVQAEKSLEEIYQEQNWLVIRSVEPADPFTKKEASAYCYVTDTKRRFVVYKITDGKILFNYSPSNFKKIIQEHFKDIERSTAYLMTASEGDYGLTGIFSHTKLTHSSGKGVVYTQNIDFTHESTPENYPEKVQQRDTIFPNEAGIKFSLSELCTLTISNIGAPELSSCSSIQFQLSEKNIGKIVSEAKNFKDDKLVLRVQTFASVLVGGKLDFFPSYYLKRKSYDFAMNVFGLTSSIEKLKSCGNS